MPCARLSKHRRCPVSWRLGGGLDNPADDDDKEAAAPPRPQERPQELWTSRDDSSTKPPQAHVERRATLGQPATLLSEMDLSGPLSAHAAAAWIPSSNAACQAATSRRGAWSVIIAQDPLAPQQSGPIERQKAGRRTLTAGQAGEPGLGRRRDQADGDHGGHPHGRGKPSVPQVGQLTCNLMRGRNHAAADMKGVEK